MRKTYIVSDYRGFYESIHTEQALCKAVLVLKYWFLGARTIEFVKPWLASLVFKFTGKRVWKGVNMSFALFVPGTDQVTYHSPWSNAY